MDLRPHFQSCVEIRRTVVDLSYPNHIFERFMLHICFCIQDAFPIKAKGYFYVVFRIVINVKKDILAVIGMFEEFLFEIID
jgi:hypothetical protein